VRVCTGLDFGQGQGDMERLRDVYERADELDYAEYRKT